MNAEQSPSPELIRLRTQEGASVRGHALLVGAPLHGMPGVGECLRLMRSWLGADYVEVKEEAVADGGSQPTRSTRDVIEQHVKALRAEVRHGDQVLLYFAGHGKQLVPDARVHDAPVAAFLPQDADGVGPVESRTIPGYVLTEWLADLATACGADRQGPLSGAGDEEGGAPSVTVVLDCCHAAGLIDRWPSTEAGRAALMRQLEREFPREPDRGAFDPAPGVLWIVAAGRDEIAQGPPGNRVGLMTRALTKVLSAHPGEPWWAVMQRLHATWEEPTHTPGLAGPMDAIPLSSARMGVPDGWLPCVRANESSELWRVDLGMAAGWQPGQSVTLTAGLSRPQSAHGRLEEDAEGRLCVRLLDDHASGLAGVRFAWAWRIELGSTATVAVWGGGVRDRRRTYERLEDLAGEVLDLGGGTGHESSQWPVTFEVDGGEVVVHDRWGDVVARSSLDDGAAWPAWIDRLVALDDWLDLETSPVGWSVGAFKLRCGTWDDHGRRVECPGPIPVVTPEVPVWVELEANTCCVPAYVGLFRVRGDRGVEELTGHLPGGMPVTGRYRVAGVGEPEKALRLTWPRDVVDGGDLRERLVAVVSDQPLVFAFLQRAGLGDVMGRPLVREGRKARVWMGTRRYRLLR